MRYLSNLLSLGMLVVFLSSCESETSKSFYHETFVLVDNTEKSASRTDVLTLDGVVGLFENENDEQGYGKITFSEINNVSMNGEKSVEFLPLPSGATNLQKKRHLEVFRKDLVVVYENFLGPSVGKSSSSIYLPMCKAMEVLAQSKADKKTLILLSDMVEFSSCSNFYRLSQRKIEEIITDLQACYPFPLNCDGITVVILYQPTSEVTDEKFREAMKVWSEIFASHRITYSVHASLNN